MMQRTVWVMLALAISVPVFAQEGEKTPEQRAREEAERRVEWQLRAYRSLELSESQTEQIKALLVAEELAAAKQRDERRDKVRALLTPAQTESFNEMIERQNRGGPGAQGGQGMRGAGGMMGRGMGMDVDQLRERLKLTEEQLTQIQGVIGEIGQQMMEKMREVREQGGMDFDKMREAMEGVRKDARTRIGKLLTPEQMPEFEKLSKEMDEQLERWTGRRAEGERRLEAGPRRPQTPEELTARRTDEAMTALALEGEEAAVIRPLIEKLVSYQVTAGRALRELRESIGKLEDEAAIRGRMEEYRKGVDEYRTKVELLTNGLRELVTVQQEAKLFALRIFDLTDGAAATTGE